MAANALFAILNGYFALRGSVFNAFICGMNIVCCVALAAGRQ